MASKLLNEILDELKDYEPIKKKYSNDYYLGTFIGKEIVNVYLLNVDVDSIYNKCVHVSEEEFEEAARLYNIVSNAFTYDRNYKTDTAKEAHKNWLSYVKSLELKYLPKTIDCYFPQVELTINQDIYQGIKDAIWDCDFSNYDVTEDLIGQSFGFDKPITIYLQIK